MYVVYKLYLYEGGSGNFARENVGVQQAHVPGGGNMNTGKVLQKAKEDFKRTFGVYPFVEYHTVDTDCPVGAMIETATGAKDHPWKG